MPKKKSPSLANLQKWMRRILTDENGVEQALKNNPEYLSVIQETPELKRADRLDIYSYAYFWRIIDVLADNYSSVKNVVGEHEFNHLAENYLVKFPSIFKSVEDIGGTMKDFVEVHPLQKKFPFLSQLAQLEWAAHQAFFADDTPLLNPKHFKGLSDAQWISAKISLDPSIRLLSFEWPVDQLWKDDGKWTASQIKKIRKQQCWVMVIRRADLNVRVPRISEPQFQLLTALQQRKPLGKALMMLVQKHHQQLESLPVQSWFQQWIEDGVIKKISFGNDK